jgi:DNA-binding CsgD family transcriptional regulator
VALQQAIQQAVLNNGSKASLHNGHQALPLEETIGVQRLAAISGALLISRAKPRKPLPVIVVPFQGESSAVEVPRALVFLNDPDLPPRPRAHILHSLYGLSPLQVKLADLLLSGSSVKEAARNLRVTESSARFHLKVIYRKAGVSSQVELVRLLLHFPGA